jgi:hypothetical protein
MHNAEYKCCTTYRDNDGHQCNYFYHRKGFHNDHASGDSSPRILDKNIGIIAPILFAHQVQPKMDCRSTALTNAAREVIGLIIADKKFPVADKVMKKPGCISESDTNPTRSHFANQITNRP